MQIQNNTAQKPNFLTKIYYAFEISGIYLKFFKIIDFSD